jgi:itaconate CoA-transferase
MLPLEGITVVSLEQAVAAPFATRQLADLGARVIKVERPEVGDFARGYDRTVKGLASHFVWLNRSKESLTLDLKQDGAKEVLARIIERADVFVQNLAPGATGRLGFGAQILRERHPSLIVCDISGYGSSGPYRDKKAYDLLVQCEAGLVSITGTPETPSKVGVSIADIACGMYAYSGILAALLRRGRTGEGAALEVSLFEALAEWMGFPAYYAMYGGKEPPRTGASHAAIAPYGPFECGDGKVIFLGIQNEREWERFCEVVLEQPALAEDERFASNSERVENRDDLYQDIEAILQKFSSSEAIERLEEAKIANARMRTVRGLLEHPQLEARDRWREVGSPVGSLRALLPPAIIDTIEPLMAPIPSVSEHTEKILAELGYDDDTVATLRQAAAICVVIEIALPQIPYRIKFLQRYCNQAGIRGYAADKLTHKILQNTFKSKSLTGRKVKGYSKRGGAHNSGNDRADDGLHPG